MTRARSVDRVLDQLHGVNVARTVGEDPLDLDPHDALGARILLEKRIVQVQTGHTIQAQARRPLEVYEQESDVWVDCDVAEASEHAVPVVVGEGERALVDNANEPGQPALIRALWPPFLVSRGKKEHGRRADEGAITLSERRAGIDLLQTVSDSPAIEVILQLPRAVVVSARDVRGRRVSLHDALSFTGSCHSYRHRL